jgi:hypothetical protein
MAPSNAANYHKSGNVLFQLDLVDSRPASFSRIQMLPAIQVTSA